MGNMYLTRETEEGSVQAVLRNGRRHPVRKKEDAERARQPPEPELSMIKDQ